MNNSFYKISNKFADFLNFENAHFLNKKRKMLYVSYKKYDKHKILCFFILKVCKFLYKFHKNHYSFETLMFWL